MLAYAFIAVNCLHVFIRHLLDHVTRLCFIQNAVNQSHPGTIDMEQATEVQRCCEEVHVDAKRLQYNPTEVKGICAHLMRYYNNA